MRLHPSRRPPTAQSGFVAAAGLVIGVGSTLIAGSAAKRAAKNQKRELAQRQADIKAQSEQDAAAIIEAGNAAAAPLSREASLLRDAEAFRNPLLTQAITESVRRQADALVTQDGGTSRNPAAARSAIARQLFDSRPLLAREAQRADRAQRLLTARTQLLAQAGQFKTGAAQQAAAVRTQASTTLSGLAFPETAPSTSSAVAGAIGSSFDSLSDEQKKALDAYLSKLFGSGGGTAAPDFSHGVTVPGSNQSFPIFG